MTGTTVATSDNVINVSLFVAAGNLGAAGYFSGFADAPSISVGGTVDLCTTNPITLSAESITGFTSF